MNYDTSDTGFGAVLYQLDEKGDEKAKLLAKRNEIIPSLKKEH